MHKTHFDYDIFDGKRLLTVIENFPDACLAAAAPELFNALKDLSDEIESNYDQANMEGSKTEKVRMKLLKEAARVLAKAEGK